MVKEKNNIIKFEYKNWKFITMGLISIGCFLSLIIISLLKNVINKLFFHLFSYLTIFLVLYFCLSIIALIMYGIKTTVIIDKVYKTITIKHFRFIRKPKTYSNTFNNIKKLIEKKDGVVAPYTGIPFDVVKYYIQFKDDMTFYFSRSDLIYYLSKLIKNNVYHM